MTVIILISVAVIAIGVVIFGARRQRQDNEMGTLSSQWLDDHRREAHQTSDR